MTFKKGNIKGKDPQAGGVHAGPIDLKGQEAPNSVGEGLGVAKEAIVAPEATTRDLKAIPEAAGKSIWRQLTELMFYHEYGTELTFEMADEARKSICSLKAQEVCLCIDQMNMMIVPKRDLNHERREDKQLIINVIRTFMEKMNHPKDLQKTFPIEELAVRIQEGRLT